MKQTIVTVFGKDRPGIIADITAILYKSGSNLEDITMTILEGEFSMIMIIKLPSPSAVTSTRKRMKAFAEKSKMTVHWKELDHQASKGQKHAKGTVSYILSAIGRDQTGIVYGISSLFAKEKLNITDLNSRVLPGKKGDLYVVMLEVDMPRLKDVSQIKKKLERLSKKIAVDIQFKPIDILQF